MNERRSVEGQDELQTPRLRLRRWLPSDRDAFAAINADPKVMRYLPGPLSREQSDAMVDRIEAHFEQHGFGLWNVEVRGVTHCAGFIGLTVPRFEAPFTPCVEIGWRLASDQWGKGYATEGALAALRYGFEKLQLDEIISMTVPKNVASRRVMEKIGLKYDPNGDFDHPMFPDDPHLCRHVLYRGSAEELLNQAEPRRDG